MAEFGWFLILIGSALIVSVDSGIGYVIIFLGIAFIVIKNYMNTKNKSRDMNIPYSDTSSHTEELIKKYKIAYNSGANEELKIIVEEMIGIHWACAYEDELDDCILLENVASNFPYFYENENISEKGDLKQIFREQNIRIRELKGK